MVNDRLFLVQEMERIARESEARMEARMVAQEARMETRMVAQEARMETRMVAQEARMETHLNQSVADILAESTRVAQQTGVEIGACEARILTALQTHHQDLTDQIAALATDTQAVLNFLDRLMPSFQTFDQQRT